MTADQLAAELAYRIAEREEQIRTKPSGNMKKETNDPTVGSHDLLADSPTWPYVLAFAKRMEAKLEKNRHKGNREGWLKYHPWSLVERILDETVEVQQCFTHFKGDIVLAKTPEETADECADVANFCMMISDVVTTDEKERIAIAKSANND